MADKTFGNDFDHNITIRFFRRWWKLLIWVFVIALAASVAISLLITPRYKSTATLFPTNSNRLSKAIMDYHYSLDFMDYGIERDCEYAIQILSSKRMQQAVCEHFNLMEHYAIKGSNPLYKLEKQYRSNISWHSVSYISAM